MSGQDRQLNITNRPIRRSKNPLLRQPQQFNRQVTSPQKNKHFRLVGRRRRSTDQSSQRTTTAFDQPIEGPTDPRWVLAIRTAEQLQGDILAPQRRGELDRLGKLLGLSPFSVSLIIAIVQDQARRGYAPADCPTAGEMQLRMVHLPGQKNRTLNPLRTAFAVATLLAIELVLIRWWILS